MEINRFNYEEFFILYIDNELNAAERKEVEAFVRSNPDLATELDMLSDTILRPEAKVTFEDKASLLKSEHEHSLINQENYEEYFVLYADDELGADERRQVQEFVYKHPELQATLEAFETARLTPEVIPFPWKEKLYRKERKPAAIAWWKYAAAASVLLIAGALWFTNQPAEPGDTMIAEERPAVKNNPQIQQTENSPSTDLTVNEPGKNADDSRLRAEISAQQITKSGEQSGTGVKTTVANKGATIHPQRKVTIDRTTVDQAPIDEPEVAMVRNIPARITDNSPVVTVALPDETMTTLETVFTQPDVSLDDERTSNVYIANIPVDNPSLKPLLRKASNLVSRVAAIKRGEHRSLSFKNVEITIQ